MDNRNLEPSDPWLDNAFAERGLVDGIVGYDYPDPMTYEEYQQQAEEYQREEQEEERKR
jgi:hypothetical protein